jgi:hypothetical protein
MNNKQWRFIGECRGELIKDYKNNDHPLGDPVLSHQRANKIEK